MGGKFADESDGVGEEERQIVDHYFAHRCVEGGEELVLGEYFRLGQKIHQGRFAYVGISDQSDTGEFAAGLALDGFLAVDSLQFILEERYAAEYYTAVGLDLCFTGTAHADTAALAFEVRPHPCQAREQVLVLRQLDLSLRGRRLGALCENVENQRRAVENLHAQFALYVESLLGCMLN